MPQPFIRSMRALALDRGWGAAWGAGIAGAVIAAWVAWLCCARVSVYVASDRARIEVNQAVHPVQAQLAGLVVAIHLDLGREVAAGEPLVELDATSERLRAEEARARLAAQDRQREALAGEIRLQEQAILDAGEAAHAARAEAEAWLAQAREDAKQRADEAGRIGTLGAEGHAAQLDALRAESEARKGSAAAEALGRRTRLVDVSERGTVTRELARLQELRRNEALLAGEIEATQTEIGLIEKEIGRRTVRAPVAGRLGEVVATLRTGAFVREGETLAQVVPHGALRAVAEMPAATALGRVKPGLPALMRLDGFPYIQYGAVQATVTSLGTEARDGRIRVELAVERDRRCAIPLEHGLTGTVEVEVEQVSPATLALRAAGELGGRE
jgi:membrane fusion protein (multidrug efflux system)